MWLVPESEQVVVGRPAQIQVAVGMDFPVSISAIAEDRLTLTATDGSKVAQDLSVSVDEEAAVTTVSFTPPSSGIWLIGATTAPRTLELAADKFNDYLLHDGMPHVLAGRMDRGELGEDAVERYSKYTKALLAVGDGSQDSKRNHGWAVARKPLGHRLEIVLLDPLPPAGVGHALRAKVLFEGKPLVGANLCWDHPGNGERFSGQTWTDEAGTASVPLAQEGKITLRLVHMTRPADDDIGWESFWSSLTFFVPER